MLISSLRVISRTAIAVAVSLLVLGLWGPPAGSAYGAGAENNRRAEDLNITVDSRWTGCIHGGYYPIRIRVHNLGKERTVSFTFETYDKQGLPRVSKSVRMKPNAVMSFPLSVPMVGGQSSGRLRVSIDGSIKDALETPINLPDVDYSEFDRPGLLVISNDLMKLDEYENAVNAMEAVSSGGGSGYGSYGSSSVGENHEVIAPVMLPDRWIDYSGLDLVAISLADFERITDDERSAMINWVKTGGNLILYDVGGPPSQSAKLAELTGLNQSAAANTPWKDSTPALFGKVHLYESDSYSEFSAVTSPEEIKSESLAWGGVDSVPFQVREVMDGTIIGFRGNPFPGTRHEWAWLLKTLGPNRYHWTYRHGLSARAKNEEFLYFMIPGISGVPVIAFLILITGFSIVIGPLNYYFLSKQKRLYLLVLTIPFIAVVTSISLFSYSIVAHGFSTKSRIRSLTTVDQGANKSVTTARVSLYSGLAPSDGLQFTADTAVYPVWPSEGNETFESGSVNWTNQQALTSGWLKSRTRTQFYTVTERDERGRLTISPVANNTLKLTNGFEFDIAHLFVRGNDGKIYYGADVKAGREASLARATAEPEKVVMNIIRKARPELPENFDPYSASSSPAYYGFGEPTLHTQFNRNVMERKLQVLDTKSLEGLLGSDEYFGVLAEDPEVPIGMTRTSERDSLHLLHGYY